MKKPLYVLPNGAGVDVDTITGITAIESYEPFLGLPGGPDRVVVHAGNVSCVIPCEDMETALLLAARLIREVNELRASDVAPAAPSSAGVAS